MFERIVDRELAARAFTIEESASVASARRQWAPIAKRIRSLAKDTLLIALGAVIAALAVVALPSHLSIPGETQSWFSWWCSIRSLRGDIRSDMLLGPPAAAVVPAVVAVVLAPPSSNGPFSRDALDQSAAVEYVRAVLFGSLFLTAISSAVAAVPQPGDFLAETFVGCFFLGLSSALAALLRPQGLLLALRRVEAEARAKSYEAAIERQLKVCADAGVPAWMMKTSPWSGIFLRLAIVTKAGTPVGLWFLGVFLWEEMLAGGTTLGRAGSAGLIAIVLGSLAGASWPLAFQARGDWLSIEAGRARWAEFVSYLFLGTILLSLIGVLSAGIWLSDEVWWRRGIGLATGVTGVLGLVWPVARANSRLAVAVDYRCLLQRSQVASDQWALLGGVDEDRETYEWPFPRTRPVVE